jgi:peptide/nickel transport system substrate-binding protein
MKLRDRALIGALSFALIALSIAALGPTLQSSGEQAEPTSPVPPERAYVEGVLGRATNASPFGARSAADRALVALLFRGLVRLGPGSSIGGDLATRWEVDESGRTWTFHLRPDQLWEDGQPITADDVAFTVGVLADPLYTGPGAESWRDVSAVVVDQLTVELRLTNPLGGFLQAATQPIAPAHLLAGIPVEAISDDPFGAFPIGSGPFRLTTLDPARAVLVAATPVEPPGDPGRPNFTTPRPTDSLLTPRPTKRPDVAVPHLANVELRYYDDVELLRTDWAAQRLDAVSGLQPATAREFAEAADARLVRYPGTTLLAATLNLRASRDDFQDGAVRRALLEAIDRNALVHDALLDLGVRADSLIPPSSTMYDATVNTPLAFDVAAARKALRDAGWRTSQGSWIPKDESDPLVIELLSPEEAVNPVAYAAAVDVRDAWHELGFAVRLVPLPPTELIGDRLARGDFQVAVLPLAIGLDPDLYPLLAASQTRSGGSNVAGLQDPELDTLLVNARTPVDEAARMTAYAELQKRLVANTYILPLCFRDEYVVFRATVVGPQPRPIGGSWDRYWDVLTWRLADGRPA